jgi:hypothetical protein
MRENRKYERHRTAKVGKIVYNGASPVDCTVRDFTPSGACLLVDSVNGIPQSFTLVMTRDKITWPCRVIWKSENKIGVSFDQETARSRRPAMASQSH